MAHIAPSSSRALSAAVPLSAALLASATAEAQVIVTDAGNTTIGTSGSIYFQLGNGLGGTGTVSSEEISETQYRLYHAFGNGQKPYLQTYSTTGTINGSYAENVAPGTTIGSNYSYLDNFSLFLTDGDANPAWAPGTRGYLGLRQASVDTESGYLYAWADVTYGSDFSLTLHRFAYEQSGGAIVTPTAVPEPSTYAAIAGLLAGSAALYHRRRKKNQA